MIVVEESQPITESTTGEESEVARRMVETASGGSKNRQTVDVEFVEGVFEGLVEICPVLIRSVDHPTFTDEGAGAGSDGVEIADDSLGPQADPAEVVGAAVGGEQRLGGRGQRAELPGPDDGTVGDEKGSG